MSLASGITAAFTAVANALNARNAPGPDAYQMAVANGFVGDRAAWQASLVGNDVDYAAAFAGQLGTLQTSGNASEAQAGVTQFATLAEAFAGTNLLKAISAGELQAMEVATSLDDLQTKAALSRAGDTIALVGLDFGSGNVIDVSLWLSVGGLVKPAVPVVASTLSALNTFASSTSYGGTRTKLLLQQGETQALMWNFGGPAQGFRAPYLWNGAAWSAVAHPAQRAFGLANGQIAIAQNTLVPVPTSLVLSDPTAMMAPTSADRTKWTLPWTGHYHATLHFALTGDVEVGKYLGVGTLYDGTNLSLADVGNKFGASGADGKRFDLEFWNDVPGRKVQFAIYHQSATTPLYTANGNSWGYGDPKSTRTALEYLGG